MFNLRKYIKEGFLKAIGKMADYQIILNSTGWYEKGVLLSEDLEEIEAAIEAQYIPVPEPEAENTEEENVENTEEE